MLAILVAIAGWLLLTTPYRVQPDEQGVVQRFGKYVRTTSPGFHFKFPDPIESVTTPKVTRENQIDVGFSDTGGRGRDGATRDVQEESLMLTGDENIVDIDFIVVWRIKDAGQFLFNIREPERTVKAVSESAVREVVGRSAIDDVITEERQAIETDPPHRGMERHRRRVLSTTMLARANCIAAALAAHGLRSAGAPR